MQQPIISGAILRERYTIRHILGQGGMGRTYMAEDMERFNELCVLKEFIPFSTDVESAKKAKELFQREASTLYQIKHSQVPEFRATFEESGRLFLVQDYVDGQTYRDILIERLKHKHTFSEAEVAELLWQILPILSYLHSRKIVHRDISPENLMLRQSDGLTVLIDFGVVKETATKLISHSATMVGKLGYAPPEQMQSGRAYPNSDLYALAATMVVLLTGKEPQELFDDVGLTWNWLEFASVSTGLARVLDKMLSLKPNDRYSNAQEVLAALDFAQASLSHAKTFAVGGIAVNPQGRQNQNSNVGSKSQNSASIALTPKINQNSVKFPFKSNSWLDRLRGILFGITLVLVSGIGAWALTSMFLKKSADPPPSLPISVAPIAPTKINKSLDIQNNQAKISDKISANQAITYRFEGKKGQTLTAALNGSGLVMTLIYVDQKPIDNLSSNLTIGYWRGKLPATGAYFITIKTTAKNTDKTIENGVNVESAAESAFDLEVTLVDPIIPPKPPKPVEPPAPPKITNLIESQDLEFPPGLLTTSVEAVTIPSETLRYNVTVLKGQTLEVGIKGNVSVEIHNPQNEVVWESSNVNPPKIKNTIAGTYQILVSGGKSEVPFRIDASLSD